MCLYSHKRLYAMMKRKAMKELANMLKALADETRLKMMSLLFKKGELCVCDFVSVLVIDPVEGLASFGRCCGKRCK